MATRATRGGMLMDGQGRRVVTRTAQAAARAGKRSFAGCGSAREVNAIRHIQTGRRGWRRAPPVKGRGASLLDLRFTLPLTEPAVSYDSLCAPVGFCARRGCWERGSLQNLF